MNRVRFLLFGATVFLMASVFFFACQKREPGPTEPQQHEGSLAEIPAETQATLTELENIGSDPIAYYSTSTNALSKSGGHCRVVYLDAGSDNALQDAISRAGRGGVVVVKRGLHTEDNMVTIPYPLTVVGESGATLSLDTDPVTGPLGATPLEVGLYVLNTHDVSIWGLNILPVGAIGGTAILVQNSPDVVIARNTVRGHQWSVLIQNGNRARIWGNRVEASTAWQTGEIPEAEGIILINGKKGLVSDNEASGAFFGIWPCDTNGVYIRNYTHENYYGVILCCVPEESFLMPNGELVGSRIPTTHWFVANNRSNNNFDSGYLVIDGANHNLLVNNAASGNAVYDVDLSGDSYRFGFLTPHSESNKIIAGRFNLLIKDCGVNNTIMGGTLAPDDAAHPCR